MSNSPVTVDLAKAWKPYRKQALFINSHAFFNLFLAGVGAGKTHALCAWVLTRAIRNPEATGALLGRTSVDLGTTLLPCLFDRLEDLREATGINWIRSYDKGNAKITLLNGSEILFRPFNRIQKLRGPSWTFAALDEVEFAEAPPEEIWTVVTGRLRGHGPCPGLACATSPNGLRGITKKFVDAQRQFLDAKAKGDLGGMRTWGMYHTVTATSFDNPHNPPHFFESLRSMSKRRYQQEVEGRVLRPLHTVLTLEPRHLIDWDWRSNPTLQRVYGVDWGTQDHHVALMAQVRHDGTWVVCDQLVCDGIPRGQFQNKLHAWIESHGRAAPALIGVDRAAPAENGILERHFRSSRVAWMESREEQKVTEGIEMTRDLMEPLDGEPKLLFAQSLPQVVTGLTAGIVPALRGYCYHLDDQGQPTTRPKKDNTTDHAVDALRYCVRASAEMAHLHGGRTLYMPQTPSSRPDQARTSGNSGRQD